MASPDIQEAILDAFENRALLVNLKYRSTIENVINDLDNGNIRCSLPIDSNGLLEWQTQEWVKKAILLYFSIREMQIYEVGPFEYLDKIPLKKNYSGRSIRVVPPATIRYGAYVAPGCIVMPSYINIGAYVGSGTMVDTWATVGSCAQIGENVHLSGGVGIGGVLEPPQASPVIIEDGAFIGSRCVIVEGVRIGREAVIGAGVVLTAGTNIIDVSGDSPIEIKGYVPERSVVIPGMRSKKFPAGEYNVPCALIIGKRTETTDLKTSLNQALRDFEISV